MPDAAFGRRNALVNRIEDRMLESLPRKLREDPIDGVHPGGRGRREVESSALVALRPVVGLGRLVRGDIVKNDMNRGSGPDPLADLVEQGELWSTACSESPMPGKYSHDRML